MTPTLENPRRGGGESSDFARRRLVPDLLYNGVMPIRHVALTLLLATSGCILVNGDDDCDYGGVRADGEAGAAVYDPGIRNPATGECEYWGGGGGGGSCDACGNCPDVPVEDDREPTPTWGTCESSCEGLDQATCEATSACRAIFVDQGGLGFAACWPTDTTGPLQGGGCEGLDAFACSLHDDCSAVHDGLEVAPGDGDPGLQQAIGSFASCIPEGGSTGPGSCEGTVTCDRVEPACPEGTTPGIAGGCYTGYCIPLEDCGPLPACGDAEGEASCIERADCTPIYEGVNCECAADVCECDEWTYTHCE